MSFNQKAIPEKTEIRYAVVDEKNDMHICKKNVAFTESPIWVYFAAPDARLNYVSYFFYEKREAQKAIEKCLGHEKYTGRWHIVPVKVKNVTMIETLQPDEIARLAEAAPPLNY